MKFMHTNILYFSYIFIFVLLFSADLRIIRSKKIISIKSLFFQDLNLYFRKIKMCFHSILILSLDLSLILLSVDTQNNFNIQPNFSQCQGESESYVL